MSYHVPGTCIPVCTCILVSTISFMYIRPGRKWARVPGAFVPMPARTSVPAGIAHTMYHFPSHLLYYLRTTIFSSSLPFVTQIRGHTTGTSPPFLRSAHDITTRWRSKDRVKQRSRKIKGTTAFDCCVQSTLVSSVFVFWSRCRS